MSAELPYIGSIQFTTATPPVVQGARNASVARNGVGSWDVTLGNGGVDQNQMAMIHHITVVAGAGMFLAMDSTNCTDTVKRLLAFTATAAAGDPAIVGVTFLRNQNQ